MFLFFISFICLCFAFILCGFYYNICYRFLIPTFKLNLFPFSVEITWPKIEIYKTHQNILFFFIFVIEWCGLLKENRFMWKDWCACSLDCIFTCDVWDVETKICIFTKIQNSNKTHFWDVKCLPFDIL